MSLYTHQIQLNFFPWYHHRGTKVILLSYWVQCTLCCSLWPRFRWQPSPPSYPHHTPTPHHHTTPSDASALLLYTCIDLPAPATPTLFLSESSDKQAWETFRREPCALLMVVLWQRDDAWIIYVRMYSINPLSLTHIGLSRTNSIVWEIATWFR